MIESRVGAAYLARNNKTMNFCVHLILWPKVQSLQLFTISLSHYLFLVNPLTHNFRLRYHRPQLHLHLQLMAWLISLLGFHF